MHAAPARQQGAGGLLVLSWGCRSQCWQLGGNWGKDTPPSWVAPVPGSGGPPPARLCPATSCCGHGAQVRWCGGRRQVMEVKEGRAAQPGIRAGRKRGSVGPANVLIPSAAAPAPAAWGRGAPVLWCMGSGAWSQGSAGVQHWGRDQERDRDEDQD